MHPGGVIGHLRSPRLVRRAGVAGALAAGVAVLASGCGTAPGVDGGGAGSSPRAEEPAVPMTDDPSLRTLDAPQHSTLDTAQAAGVAEAPTATGSDGVELEVVSADCGVPGVRSEGYSVRAAGQFCVVAVEVVNRGAAAAAFDPGRTALVDGEGGRTPPASDALALPALAAAAAQVPAATALSATLVFDVPAGADPRELELDGSARAPLPPLG